MFEHPHAPPIKSALAPAPAYEGKLLSDSAVDFTTFMLFRCTSFQHIIYYLSLKMHSQAASQQNEESLWVSLENEWPLTEQNFCVKIRSQFQMTSS